MKHTAILSLLLCLSLLTVSCEIINPAAEGECSFEAVIIELYDTTALVEPVEGTVERKSSNRITFSTSELNDIGVSIGNRVFVTYTGCIRESYPAQIKVISWTLVEKRKVTLMDGNYGGRQGLSKAILKHRVENNLNPHYGYAKNRS